MKRDLLLCDTDRERDEYEQQTERDEEIRRAEAEADRNSTYRLGTVTPNDGDMERHHEGGRPPRPALAALEELEQLALRNQSAASPGDKP